ncbi:MAG: Rne/Rng family ribonuclease, partial [bacterium]
MKEILVNVESKQIQIAILENKSLIDFFIKKNDENKLIGSIYKGKVTQVLQGIQSAFVDIGGQIGFLSYKNFDKDFNTFLNIFTEGVDISEKKSLLSKYQDSFSNQNVLTKGQEILVQVIKNPIGNKCAKLNSYISLSGQYIVLLPKIDNIAISKQIKDKEKRKELKNIISEIKPEGIGIIARTISQFAKKEDFLFEINFLSNLWESIKKKFDEINAPYLLLSSENDIINCITKEIIKDDFKKLLINSENLYNQVVNYINKQSLSLLLPKIKLFKSKIPLFDFYGINKEIKKALEKKVMLKSGSYLIIEPTEALCSIDINTGKYLGKENLEETALSVNIEACKEIARQIRLRNVGGLIVIDFIDMKKEENKKTLISEFKKVLQEDRIKTHIFPSQELSLIALTRERTSNSLLQEFSQKCPYCKGKSYILKQEKIFDNVVKEIEKITLQNKGNEINIKA